MDEQLISAVFKSKPSKQEAKADITTRAAQQIIDSEAAARLAKTERLRAARIAQKTVATIEVAIKKKPQPKR